MNTRLPFYWSLGIMLCALAFPASPGEEATTARRYAIPEHGFFELQAPARWSEIVRRRPGEPGPPTIVFGPTQGTPFEVSVTPAWEEVPGGPAAEERSMRERVEKYLEGVKPGAVEKQIDLVKIESPPGPGFYFSATDQAPRSGDYKFLTHGMFKAGGLAVSFTILTRDGQAQIVRDALAMLKTAKHIAKQ
jgi:hypothetical protein